LDNCHIFNFFTAYSNHQSQIFTRMVPAKLRFFYTTFKNRPFTLLDVGAGNHSATRVKGIFPKCTYHGIDMETYNNTSIDLKAMDRYFEMDVTKLLFDDIPDNFYDAILMAHIIEHLHNGDQVIARLCKKLKPCGYIYIEYPGKKSLRLPSMKETLNFHDDPTHVRLYTVEEVAAAAEGGNCRVLKKGTRRYWPYILLTPVKIIMDLVQKKYISGVAFWDILGFAEFVYAQKK